MIWSYETHSKDKTHILKLDGRIEPTMVNDKYRSDIIIEWMKKVSQKLQIDPRISDVLRGIVMEVRQGYKSKDSKRQNADITNATEAYINGYLTVLILFSTQIDNDVVARYEREKWLVLRGTLLGDETQSTYTFMCDIVGYDLAGFFGRNRHHIKTFTQDILQSLLSADND